MKQLFSFLCFSEMMAFFRTVVLILVVVYIGLYVFHNTLDVIYFLHLPKFITTSMIHGMDMLVVKTLFSVVATLGGFFLIGFFIIALLDGIRLSKIVIQLRAFDKEDSLIQRMESKALNWWFYPLFDQLWQKYTQTMRSVCFEHHNKQVTSYQSAIVAEQLFTTTILIDMPTRIEFFKHLPGILTGLGIISTFAGILLGLSNFDPNVGADQITSQLHNLFQGVSTAFIASFIAISCAVLITFIEKFVLQWRYSQVISLQGQLNSLFSASFNENNLSHHPIETKLDTQRNESEVTAFLQPDSQQINNNSKELISRLETSLNAQVATTLQSMSQVNKDEIHLLGMQSKELGAELTQQFSQTLKDTLDAQNKLISQLHTELRLEKKQLSQNHHDELATFTQQLSQLINVPLVAFLEENKQKYSANEKWKNELSTEFNHLLSPQLENLQKTMASVATEIINSSATIFPQLNNTLENQVDLLTRLLHQNQQNFEKLDQKQNIDDLMGATNTLIELTKESAIKNSDQLSTFIQEVNAYQATKIKSIQQQTTDRSISETKRFDVLTHIAEAINTIQEHAQSGVLNKIEAHTKQLNDINLESSKQHHEDFKGLNDNFIQCLGNIKQMNQDNTKSFSQITSNLVSQSNKIATQNDQNTVRITTQLNTLITENTQKHQHDLDTLNTNLAQGIEQIQTEQQLTQNSTKTITQLSQDLLAQGGKTASDLLTQGEKITTQNNQNIDQLSTQVNTLITEHSQQHQREFDALNNYMTQGIEQIQMEQEITQDNTKSITQLTQNLLTQNDKITADLIGLGEKIITQSDQQTDQISAQLNVLSTENSQQYHRDLEIFNKNLKQGVEQIQTEQKLTQDKTNTITQLSQDLLTQNEKIAADLFSHHEKTITYNEQQTNLISTQLNALITESSQQHHHDLEILNNNLTQGIKQIQTKQKLTQDNTKSITLMAQDLLTQGDNLTHQTKQQITQVAQLNEQLNQRIIEALNEKNKVHHQKLELISNHLNQGFKQVQSKNKESQDQLQSISVLSNDLLAKYNHNAVQTEDQLTQLNHVITRNAKQNDESLNLAQNQFAIELEQLKNEGKSIANNQLTTLTSVFQSKVKGLSDHFELILDKKIERPLTDIKTQMNSMDEQAIASSKTITEDILLPLVARFENKFSLLDNDLQTMGKEIDQTKRTTIDVVQSLRDQVQTWSNQNNAEMTSNLNNIVSKIDNIQASMLGAIESNSNHLHEDVVHWGDVLSTGLKEYIGNINSELSNHVKQTIAEDSKHNNQRVEEIYSLLSVNMEKHFMTFINELNTMHHQYNSQVESLKTEFESWVDELGQSTKAETRMLLDMVKSIPEQTGVKQESMIRLLFDFSKTMKADFEKVQKALTTQPPKPITEIKNQMPGQTLLLNDSMTTTDLKVEQVIPEKKGSFIKRLFGASQAK